MKDKKRILLCGDSLNGYTGLSSVSSRLLKYLYDLGEDVVYYGLVNLPISSQNYIYYGEDYKDCFMDCTLYDYRSIAFDTVAKEFEPDIVITIQDPWRLNVIYTSTYRNSFIWVNWALFETEQYPEYMPDYGNDGNILCIGDILRDIDINIPVTKMGARTLEKFGAQNIVENVYIGSDFSKVQKEPVTKKEVFGIACKETDFVFMGLGKNLSRKKLDYIIDAFELFLQKVKEPDKNKFKLYLHTNIGEKADGTDLRTQIAQKKLQNHILIPACFANGTIMKQEDLYKRYKAIDCYIGLPGGEGFGLGFLEALMHDKPVIYSNVGGHVEYCEPYGQAVKIISHYANPNSYIRWSLVDLDEAARQMIWVYEHRNKISAYEDLKKEFDWSIVLEKFYGILISNYDKLNSKIKFRFKRML